jgi:hypothetical protein
MRCLHTLFQAVRREPKEIDIKVILKAPPRVHLIVVGSLNEKLVHQAMLEGIQLV